MHHSVTQIEHSPRALNFLVFLNIGVLALLAVYFAVQGARSTPGYFLLAAFAVFAAYTWYSMRNGRYWAWFTLQWLFMFATLGIALFIIRIARMESETKSLLYGAAGLQIVYLAACWIYLQSERVRRFCSVPGRQEEVPARTTLERWASVLRGVTAVLMVVNLYNVFIFVPTESSMGLVQRIFYFHAPAAMTAFLAFAVTFVFSIRYLSKNRIWDDRVAYCAAEVGVLFTTIVLTTGPIWARPVWNTWWTWDPRLTTTLVLWFIYVGYMMLRTYTGEEQRGARFAAVFAIVGFVDVPIVYMANRLWRTLHPQPVVFGGTNSGLDPEMRYAFVFSILTFIFLFVFLLFQRLRLERTRVEINNVKREMAFS